MLKKWPSDYPKHIDVPPEEAESKTIEVYRLIENSPPVQCDFAASYKDPEQAHLINKFVNNPSFYGTSFFSKKQSIINLIQSNPNRFRRKQIACGNVYPEHGMVGIENSKNHLTIWFFDNTYPEGFEVV